MELHLEVPANKALFSAWWIIYFFNYIKNVGPVPSEDMQTPPLSFAPILMKDSQSAEFNEK